ncbi:pilin, partial [Patescibacteria group bacterium]|nr:pilin [Patescibacteria group bacterium]
MKFHKKIFLFAIVYLVLSPAAVAWTAPLGRVDPVFNPICWRQDDCVGVRKTTFGLEDKVASDGWLGKEAPCDKEGWGKCLPAGQTVTSISFGGKKQFANLGEYITTVYNYVLTIASILAVIVIILAGVQWAVSGGSGDQINSAKKRITGALVGLLIAFLSYAILNTLNPNLVNLRLPQVYLIRPFAVAFDYCRDMATTTQFADVSNQAVSDLKPLYQELAENAFYYIKTNPTDTRTNAKDAKDFVCNQKFFVKDANAAICWGHDCSKESSENNRPYVCVKDSKSPGYACKKGDL